MSRTNIDIDDDLIQRVMTYYGIRTKREAVDFALRNALTKLSKRDILKLKGMGWGGDLDEMRSGDPIQEF